MKRKSCTACLILLASVLSAWGQQVSVFVTSKAGDRLASKPVLHFQQEPGRKPADFRIDDSTVYRT